VIAYRPQSASCRVVDTATEVPASGLQFTADGTAECSAVLVGLDAMSRVEDWALPPLHGKIAVIRTPYPYVAVPELVAGGARGVVILGETPDGLAGHFSAQLYPPSPPPDFPGVPHPIPGVTIEARAGAELQERLRAGELTLHLEHRARYELVQTANVVGEIPGRGHELVVCGAHYDSQFGTVGACDNATGIAALIAFARANASLDPLRTVALVAFADEEHGCYGSLAYCRHHADELPKTVAMINLDALGWGEEAKRSLWADPSIRDYCIGAIAAIGWHPDEEQDASVFSGSDYNPFLDAGVPAAFMWRYPPGNPYYHSAGDCVDRLDFKVVNDTARAASHLLLQLANDPHLDLGRSRPSRVWLDLLGTSSA
jgi:hypothetical protein